MQYGVILRKTRKDIGLSQEEIAEKLFFNRSKISKLESGKQTLYAEDLVKWMDVAKRKDIVFALISGLNVDQVMKHLFSEKYLNRVNECALFQNAEEALEADDIENYIFNATEEVKEWKEYLNELISDKN